MNTIEQLREKSGTPEEFAAACNRACDDLFCTTEERDAAIAKYSAEWAMAGLSREISEYWDERGVDYSGPGIIEAVFDARPDLKARYDDLVRVLEQSGKE